jgi:hypothetical protein
MKKHTICRSFNRIFKDMEADSKRLQKGRQAQNGLALNKSKGVPNQQHPAAEFRLLLIFQYYTYTILAFRERF